MVADFLTRSATIYQKNIVILKNAEFSRGDYYARISERRSVVRK